MSMAKIKPQMHIANGEQDTTHLGKCKGHDPPVGEEEHQQYGQNAPNSQGCSLYKNLCENKRIQPFMCMCPN